MNEKKAKQVLSGCVKIGKLIRIVWGILTVLVILCGFSMFLMLTSIDRVGVYITPAKIGDDTIYAVGIGSDSPEDNFFYLNSDLDADGIRITQRGLEHPHWICLFYFLSAYVILCVIYYVAAHLRRIFLNFSDDETPFTMENCMHIKKIGLAAVVLSFTEPMLFSFLCAIFGFASFSFDIHVEMLVLLGGSCIALAKIFEYGVALQQESDELI